MQSLRSELVYGEVDYVEAFSNGRQLPDSIIEQWCDCIDHIVGKLGIDRPTVADLGCGDGRLPCHWRSVSGCVEESSR